MATYSVVIREEAKADFLGIPFPFRRQLNELIFKLMAEPRPKGSVLIDGDTYRLAAHGWAVLYEIDDGANRITLGGFRPAATPS